MSHVGAEMGAQRLHARIQSKRWPDGREVLRDVALLLRAGEVVALAGPSGCGKSTLLAILAGLDREFEGSVALTGRLGVVFQTPRLLPWRSARQNLMLALAGRADAAARADDALARMGLAEAAHQFPAHMSLGMQRRAAIARALAVEPDVLLLDEAFVSLDDATAEQVRAQVLAQARRDNMAVLMVSHDAADLERMADRVLRLEGCPATTRAGI
jgi:NitT/TauT family transport system ATP-binding protein